VSKKVLVTGASGFIGRQALPLLVDAGFEVCAVSQESQVSADGVEWFHGDLLDAPQRQSLFAAVQPTHVLHFAWIATPGVYWTSPLNEAWKEATLDLLRLSSTSGARFVGAGSCAEYDWSAGKCDETTSLNPSTPYGMAKAETGKAVVEAGGAWGRIFHIYGPHEHPSRLVPSVIRSLLKGEEAKCTHGAQERDFLHVADVASAFVELLESDVRGAVNIASGNPVTIRSVVETIAHQLKGEDKVRFGAVEPPANDPPVLTAVTDRLKREVGWQPSIPLEEGIAGSIEYWRMQL
jgi:nucleoside-diphosphate-sugar epimerase